MDSKINLDLLTIEVLDNDMFKLTDMYADFTIKDKFPYIDTEKGGTEDYKLIGYKTENGFHYVKVNRLLVTNDKMDLPIKRGKSVWGWSHGEGEKKFRLSWSIERCCYD